MWVKASLPKPTPICSVLWEFASKRQAIYMARAAAAPPPWTTDPILKQYRFTNAFRAADRVSQVLIRMVYSDERASADTLLLRTLLFKIFNRIPTWEALVHRGGLPCADAFEPARCAETLAALRARGVPIYSAAYIMPSGGAGLPKHEMHLSLIGQMLRDHLPERVQETKNLQQVYELLLGYPSLGPFLAFQYTIDLAYTSLVSHPESEFVVPGPGALDGLSKCFMSLGGYSPAATIMWLTEIQDQEFARHSLSFDALWGRRLQPIDIQNLLCEVSKYTRVSHPEVAGLSGRTRVKQSYTPGGDIEAPFFPPKWGINETVSKWIAQHRAKMPPRTLI